MSSLLPIILSLLAFSAPAAASAGAQQGQEGETVAWIDVLAPEQESFVLRATIPLPRGELSPGAESIPFGVISHSTGKPVIPAQVAGVSRYPTGEWDVVQLLALVQRKPEERPGEPSRFAVVRAAHPPAPAHVPGEVLRRRLLPRERRLVLRARDVYGNLYAFDLLADAKDPGFGARTVRKAGRWLNQFRVAGVMMPVEEPDAIERAGPPLPHLLGVIAWFSDYTGELPLSLDLRLHNGVIAGSRPAEIGEEVLGPVYWQSLELCVPSDLKVLPKVRDPFFGAPYREGELVVYPIVAPYEDGQLHLMAPQMQFLRRLAVVPRGGEQAGLARLANDGLGFCAHSTTHWSWSNPETARYFPQRDLLPSMDFIEHQGNRGKRALRLLDEQRVEQLAQQLASGEPGPYPSKSPVLGWAHPYFISVEGGTGGEEISFVEGHRAIGGISTANYSRLELVHRMNASRQPQAMWDRRGEPVGFFEWVEKTERGPVIPFDFRNYARQTVPAFRLPYRGGPPVSEQVKEVARTKRRPPYDGGTPFERGGKHPGSDEYLLNWMPHDGQHWVRYTKNAKALLWLGDDPTAEDDLRLCAELLRLGLHEAETPDGLRIGITLRRLEKLAERSPHQGLPVDRETAWGIDAFCAYYSTAEDEWRARHLSWAKRLADVLVDGATPGGVIIRSGYGPLLQNPKYEGAHAFQTQLLLLAQRSLCESVFRGIDDRRRVKLERLLLRTVEYLYWGPVWQRLQSSRSSVYEQGPRWAFAVANKDEYQTPPFSDEKRWGKDYLPEDAFNGGLELSYGYNSLSLAADLTQAEAGRGLGNRYLRRTLVYGQTHPDLSSVYHMLFLGNALRGIDRTGTMGGFLARLQLLEVAR